MRCNNLIKSQPWAKVQASAHLYFQQGNTNTYREDHATQVEPPNQVLVAHY
jgi:hypothetical protein